MKNEILNDLELCIILSELGENTLLTSKLVSIKETLMREWSMSDNYYDEIMQEIQQ